MSALTITLAEFLLARITEDKASADEWHNIFTDDLNALQTFGDCECNGKARVLAECEAKTAIVELYLEVVRDEVMLWDQGMGAGPALDAVLQMLAQPYADHDGFRAEWRVSPVAGSHQP